VADSVDLASICRDLLVVPVPSGLLMVTGRLAAGVDPEVHAACGGSAGGGWSASVVFGRRGRVVLPVQRYLQGLTDVERDGLVVVPWRGRVWSVARRCRRRMRLRWLMPMGCRFVFRMVRSGRGEWCRWMPMVWRWWGRGFESSAMWVLPGVRAAARESVRVGLDEAADGRPSWLRLRS